MPVMMMPTEVSPAVTMMNKLLNSEEAYNRHRPSSKFWLSVFFHCSDECFPFSEGCRDAAHAL